MTIDPTRYSGPPAEPRSEQENAIYARLTELGIPFYRVDHEHADTMEDCLAIEKVLGGKICKNLFLCNRQGTRFYLLMMPGNKPFKTRSSQRRHGQRSSRLLHVHGAALPRRHAALCPRRGA